MTIEEIRMGMSMLQASYPNMAKLDDAAVTAYVQELGPLRSEDFEAARVMCVRNSKFFPSIAEFLEAADSVVRKRIEAQDHEEREERLALQAVFDPTAKIHDDPIGPNHARFLRLLRGEEVFPEPEWMKRKAL